MTRIPSTPAPGNLLRERWTARQRTPGSAGASGAAPTARATASRTGADASGPAKTAAGHGAALVVRVRSIASDDPQREHKAFRMFLEATLLEQFGSDVINDPAFYQLVDQVHTQMCNDPALEASMRAAVLALITSAESPTSARP
jgi:hypothetical protein